MSKLICDVVTPAEKLYSSEAYMVVVPGIEGELGFLVNHEPLVTVLADGVARIQYEKDGDMERYLIQGGYVEVTGKKVIILADRACPESKIDAQTAEKKIKDLEAQLAAMTEEEAAKTTISADLSWYKMQVGLAQK